MGLLGNGLHAAFWLLVLIGIMIAVHELGHFWAARFFDVRVDVFSFGFGPRLFGVKKGDTDYRVSAIPFGGYVKMAGEQPGDENADDPRGFLAKPRWQRLIVVFAGPFMNVVLAVALLTGLYMVKYQKVVDSDSAPVIGSVGVDTPAAKAGLQDGDKIVALEGHRKPTWEDIVLKEELSAKHPIRLTIERAGKQFPATVTPVMDERAGIGTAGWSETGEVQLGRVDANMPAGKAGLHQGDLILSANGHPMHVPARFHEVVRGSKGKPVTIEYERNGQKHEVTVEPVWNSSDGPPRWIIGAYVETKVNIVTTRLSLPEAFQVSVQENVHSAGIIFQFLRAIVERRVSPRSLTGPIGIADLAGQAATLGPSTFIMLMSMVSLNLAIFNLLPIPIMDGGGIVMLFIEMLMRRDMSMSMREALFKVGFVFIMVLVAFVIYSDISKHLPAG